MKTSTYIYSMGALALVSSLIGCAALMAPDPVTGVTPLEAAGGAAVDGFVRNPSVPGVVEGLVAAAVVIAGAFFGRKKIAAGARVAGRVVGIVKKETSA